MATGHRDWCVSVDGKIIYQGVLSKSNVVFSAVSETLSLVGRSDVAVVLFRSAYGPVDSKTLII